jgi:hypothetical protein
MLKLELAWNCWGLCSFIDIWGILKKDIFVEVSIIPGIWKLTNVRTTNDNERWYMESTLNKIVNYL